MAPARPYSAPGELAGRLIRSGKVRDLYQAGDHGLVVVASDRISAFDVVLGPGIPGKGIVLTQLSNFWFEKLADVVGNHLVATELDHFPEPFRRCPELSGRACLVRRLEILPVECVVRGYIVGSGWKEYVSRGSVCGIPLPAGLRVADRLAEPIFTPSTKEDVGHDENIPFDEAAALIGGELAEQVRDISLRLYRRAAVYAEERGVILADTKFEFGRSDDGAVVWADEAFTPDSSRFWPAEEYRPGENPPSFDKQYVRDWLETLGWDKKPPAPTLPAEVIEGTLKRYLEAYEKITGNRLAL